MSEKFVASNGIAVRRLESFGGVWWDKTTPEKEEVALREFFQHERDTELGRWRWPEKPDYVVIPKPLSSTGRRMVRVVSEAHGYGSDHCEGDREQNDHRRAAAAYFAAHPEPKPWHDAKPGEVWAVTTENVADEVALQVTPHDTFQYNDGTEWGIRDLPVVTARRIFPEVVSDDS